VTGAVHQIFGVPSSISLNSEGYSYNKYYVHDQQSYGAKWLGYYAEPENLKIYADSSGTNDLISQGQIQLYIDRYALTERDIKTEGYIYLRYYNVVNGKLLGRHNEEHNITEYSDKSVEKDKVYNNGGAEVWK
jgi:uncharacterized membrane protein